MVSKKRIKNHGEEDSSDRYRNDKSVIRAHLSRSLFRRMNETNSHLSEQGVAKFSRITRYMVEEKQLLLIRIWGSYVFIENLEWNNRNSFEWREIDIDSLEIRNLKITNKFSILVRRAIRSATIKRWKNYLRREWTMRKTKPVYGNVNALAAIHRSTLSEILRRKWVVACTNVCNDGDG